MAKQEGVSLTVLDVRRLLESRDLDERKAVLGELLIRDTYSCLQALLGVRELLALQATSQRLITILGVFRLTRLTTNRNGTPCVLDRSFEKWKTPMTLSSSLASNSSLGISSAYNSTGSGIFPIISDPVNSRCVL